MRKTKVITTKIHSGTHPNVGVKTGRDMMVVSTGDTEGESG